MGGLGLTFWFFFSLSWVLALPGFFARSLCVRVRVDKYIYRDNKIYGCGGRGWGKWGLGADSVAFLFSFNFHLFFCLVSFVYLGGL